MSNVTGSTNEGHTDCHIKRRQNEIKKEIDATRFSALHLTIFNVMMHASVVCNAIEKKNNERMQSEVFP